MKPTSPPTHQRESWDNHWHDDALRHRCKRRVVFATFALGPFGTVLFCGLIWILYANYVGAR